jgi:type III pantothenate kinase
MPGMRMMLRALAAGTDLLPLIEAAFSDAIPNVVGRSTEEAIRSGVFWGAVGGIRHIIDSMQQEIGRGHVFVTGGDSARLAELLESHAVCVPNMVLAGVLWVRP